MLTFDANEHELVVRQRAVVGHHLGGLDAAQADFAEVLLAGEAGQGHIGQVCPGVFCHFGGKRIKEVTGWTCTALPQHCPNESLCEQTSFRI